MDPLLQDLNQQYIDFVHVKLRTKLSDMKLSTDQEEEAIRFAHIFNTPWAGIFARLKLTRTEAALEKVQEVLEKLATYKSQKELAGNPFDLCLAAECETIIGFFTQAHLLISQNLESVRQSPN